MSNSLRLPPWFKVRIRRGERFSYIESLLRDLSLHTVCEGAGCPNIWECWNRGTATFMILGDVCTRNCNFCGVTKGRGGGVDRDEALRVARAVKALGLRYVVITSVTRDDLEDGGAGIFALTVEGIRRLSPGCKVELLIPDFGGSEEALKRVVEACPDVLGHNLETVRRLYPLVRPMADYDRSLRLLREAKAMKGEMTVKSSLILGLGEGKEEVIETMMDIRETGCDILTLGQYLRPSRTHLPVRRFYSPGEFEELAGIGLEMGFSHVEAGPKVRSSYQAETYCGGVDA